MGIDDLRAGPALAHYYEREGLRIMPLVSGAKGQPRFSGFGRENPDFTINPADFRDTDAVAILCGPQPIWGGEEGDWWLMCVDIDGEPPDEAWELREFGQSLPPTLTSKKRKHLWYRIGRHRREEIAQWVRLIEWSGGGVDLKWAGGYAVERGEWDGPFALERIAELPPELIDRIIALGNDSREPESLVECLGLLARVWARSRDRGGEGGCHMAALALGGILARFGVSEDEAERALIDADFWARTGTDDRTADVLSSIEAHAAHRNTYGWPQLEQVAAAPPRAVARVKKKIDRFLGRRRAALAPMAPAAAPEVDEWRAPREGDYVSHVGNRPARIAALMHMLAVRSRDFPGEVYAARQVLVRVVGATTRALRADQLATLILKGPQRCFKFNSKTKEYAPVEPPFDECLQVVAEGSWPGVQELRGVAIAPFMREDGSICETPGYDGASGWFLAQGGLRLPEPVPDRPTREQVSTACALLRMPWCDFGWTSEAAAMLPISIILSVLARAAIAGPVPVHAVDAPTMGAGKSLAVQLAGIIATGQPPEAATWPTSEEERGKTISAAAMTGDQIYAIDNVARGSLIGGSALERTLTSAGVRFRLLGVSEERIVPWRAVVTVTGNGLNFTQETGRRTLKAEIERKNLGAVEEENWTIPNVAAWCLRERPGLVWAALTILRAHAVAGRPANKPFRSFAEWDPIVAGAIQWAFGHNIVDLAVRSDGSGDENLVTWDALVSALAGALGYDTEWGWDEVVAAAGPGNLGRPEAVALRAAVSALSELGGKRALSLPASLAEQSGGPGVLNAVSWGLMLGRQGRYGDPRPAGTLRRVKRDSGIRWMIERPKEAK